MLLIVVEADREVGMGHYKRGVALARNACQMGLVPTLMLVGERFDEAELLVEKGIRIVYQPNLAPPVEWLSTTSGIVIFDLIHQRNLHHPERLISQLDAFRRSGCISALIDGSDNLSLRSRASRLPLDVIVSPYVDSGCYPVLMNPVQILNGPAYFILDPCYKRRVACRISPVAKRLLLTAGGADPTGLTLLFLDGLHLLREQRFDIRIVMGAAFSKALLAQIERHAVLRNRWHRVRLLKNPPSLCVHMRWADLALSASGLTKYELAAMGVPAILVSIDDAHVEANVPFAAIRTGIDLSVQRELGPVAIHRALLKLSNQPQARAALSQRGRRLVARDGAQRVLESMLAILSERKMR